MSSDESIWRMRVLSTAMPEYVGELIRCKDCAYKGTHDCPAKDSAEYMSFCSSGRKRDDDQR